MTPDDVTLLTRILERRKMALRQVVSAEAAEHAGLDIMAEVMMDQFVGHLELELWGEKTHAADDTRTLEFPASWWQHLKRDHAPAWFLRRWPVVTRTWVVHMTADRWRVYPHAHIPLANQGRYATVLDTLVTTHWTDIPPVDL